MKPSARKELERLSDRLIERILPKVEALDDDPRLDGCKKLKGVQDEWRIVAPWDSLKRQGVPRMGFRDLWVSHDRLKNLGGEMKAGLL